MTSKATFLAVLLLAVPFALLQPLASPANAATPMETAPAEGVIRQSSDYDFDATIKRLKADISAKGIRFFDEIDHAKLGAGVNQPIGRSTLLLFGNPPLGVQFLQANPLEGSIGPYACWLPRMKPARYGSAGRISVSSPTVIALPIPTLRSPWPVRDAHKALLQLATAARMQLTTPDSIGPECTG